MQQPEISIHPLIGRLRYTFLFVEIKIHICTVEASEEDKYNVDGIDE
jgi:hypothetical protein